MGFTFITTNMTKKTAPRESDINSIDPDKVAENPHLLPYAHHVGSAIIKPLDKGKTKGNAMSAMYQQTEGSLHKIKEQVEVLIRQAQEIHDRISISEMIYKAECGIVPVVGQEYYLYERKNKTWVLSLVSPDDWGGKAPYSYIATAVLLADHTWDVKDTSDSFYVKEDTQEEN